MKNLLFSFLVLFLAPFCFGQASYPWALKVEFEPVLGETAPGLHSFAYATYGSKWLFIGGRTNGMHGQSSNSNFETEFANTRIVVIDTVDWQWASASVTQLPQNIADPLSSTNMQYWANDSVLYMIGGYGWDSTAEDFTTYPILTAIDIAGIISAVENGDSLSAYIRQYVDTNLAVCGGELIQMDSLYYLIMGHKFEGRYSEPQQMLFTQRYTNAMRKFKIVDDGVVLGITDYEEDIDTNNFHRRDLNAVRLDYPDSSAILVLGGVFQKNHNLPYTSNIYYNGQNAFTDPTNVLQFNQYTAAHILIKNDTGGGMEDYGIIMLGGMGSSYYNDTTGTVKYDSLVPFSNTISVVFASGTDAWDETLGGAIHSTMPGFLGSNAVFIKGNNLSPTPNGELLLSELIENPGQRNFAGYLFGGIRGTKGNYGVSSANDVIYRVYLRNVDFNGLNELPGISHVSLFPNPGAGQSTVNVTIEKPMDLAISLVSADGAVLKKLHKGLLAAGNQAIPVLIDDVASGLYFVKLETPAGQMVLKYAVVK